MKKTTNDMRNMGKSVGTLSPGTVSYAAHHLGEDCAEPLIVGFRLMHRYALAYRKRFGRPVNEDYFLRVAYLDTIRGLRNLLNGDGAVAMERGITTDSKDNGVCEAAFWDCMEAGGFAELDLN